MKIGILTFHHVENYGSLLQAYALQEILQQWGHQVAFIDYRPYRALVYYVRDLYLTPHLFAYSEKARKMQRFAVAYLPRSGKTFHTRYALGRSFFDYDLLISGSDEIWNFNSIRKFDPTYFLDFSRSDAIPKVSYAASFGETADLASYRSRICSLLKQYNHLSVRDENSLQLVHSCQLSVEKVLDPTFLVDYQKLLKPSAAKDYVLVYGRLHPAQRAYVFQFAKRRQLPVVAAGYFCKGAEQNLLNLSPEEWLGYFAGASHVFTDHYHGAIFSLIFRKSFNVFLRQRKRYKVKDLLMELRLSNRLVPADDFQKAVTEKIEYEAVDQYLTPAISASRNYLLRVLQS